MNYGQTQAVKVLVGERMGFPVTNVDDAKKVLQCGVDSVHPMVGAQISKAATDLHNQLSTQTPDVLTLANKHVTDVCAEFNLESAAELKKPKSPGMGM